MLIENFTWVLYVFAAFLLYTTIRSVVSAKFTGFDEFQTGQGLCISCAWAFSTAARRLTLNIR